MSLLSWFRKLLSQFTTTDLQAILTLKKFVFVNTLFIKIKCDYSFEN